MAAGFRSVLLLSLVAASVVLFGWQVAGDVAVDLARSNVLAQALRRTLILSLLGTAAAVFALGGAYVVLGGQRASLAMQRAARIGAPLVLMGLVPPFLDKEMWDPLHAAIGIAVFVFLFERLLRMSLGAIDEIAEAHRGPHRAGIWQRRVATGLVFAGVVFYAVYMSRYTLFAHRRFQTSNFDLGQYDNVFWNALHGRPLRCTPLGAMGNWSSLSSHADFGVYFLMPFYALHPNAETLLVLQASILALGAIPLYYFARRRLSPSASCAVALAYLLYPPLHGANFYDFHFQPIAATFVLFVIWFVETRRWILLGLAFVIALSCREDISVGLTMLGVFLVVTRYRPRAGAIMAAAGALYFVTIRFYVMPMFGTGWFSDIYKDLYPEPGGPRTYGGVIQTLLSNPVFVFRTLLTAEKLRYFLQIVAPLAFLPLRRSYLLPALAPGAMFTLLTTAYPPTIDIAFQYSGHFTPYLFAAVVLALAAYEGERGGIVKGRAALAALAAATLLCTSFWGAFPPRGAIRGGFNLVGFARPTAAQEQKGRDLVELAKMIPPDAKFGVSEEELPHVSGWLNVMAMKYGPGGADYLLYATNGGGAHVAAQALATGDYVEMATRPGLALLKRK